MKYQLINEPNEKFSTIEQILYNREFTEEEIQHYLNLSDNDINSPLSLGEQNLKEAAKAIILAASNNEESIVIVDCDCDGYTSSAVLINYLYDIFPNWVTNKLTYFMHSSKQHGLVDCMEVLLAYDDKLILCPDSSSNDYEQHKILKELGKTVVVLDHHLADKVSEDAIIINNQLSDYPNKNLSGVGVTWQFCRYMDTLIGSSHANDYLDLVAIGLTGDVMSLKSFETRYLITKGLKKENIKNPFLDYMLDKNSFPLSKSDYASKYADAACTSIGAAFFVVPLINAITRSGTIEEKQLIFNSMLKFKAFENIPSNKRGHKIGEMEQLVIQAIRTATNVKNRQTKAEDAGMALLEGMIEKNNMLQHKMLLFLLDSQEIQPEIRGLIANKFMSKYQRPCGLLTKTKRNGIELYEGSMRGYSGGEIKNFKNILDVSPDVLYAAGHAQAFGTAIFANKVDNFINYIDTTLKDIKIEPVYKVDYDFNEKENNNQKIIDIANMNDYWGQDVNRAYVAITFTITDSNFQILKNNTLKINLPYSLSIIKFGGTDEEIELFTVKPNKYKKFTAICKCNQNNWNGDIYAQLMIEDIELISEGYNF